MNLLLVDDHGHAVLAVLALAAVQPDRPGVVDHDGEDGDLAHGQAGSDGLEARVDSGDARVDRRDGRAGLLKRRLGDGVVSSAELELNHGANGGCDLLGRVDLSAV